MKTLILNGSPHKKGDTAALVEAFKAEMGGDFVEVFAYDDGISPCVDCRACWKKPGCVIRDGMDEVYREITECDAVLIASPVYFSLLTGPLLSLGSRLQALYTARRFLNVDLRGKRKAGALLLAGGGDGSCGRAVDAAQCMLRHMGAEYLGYAASLNTDSVPAAEDAKALEEVRQLAEQTRERVCAMKEEE